MKPIVNRFSRKCILLYLLGIIPVTWLSLKCAPYFAERGLFGILENADDIMNDPFRIVIVKDSLRVVLYFCLFYAVGLGIYLSNDRNYRRREEHGSARWGTAKDISPFMDPDPANNIILTKTEQIPKSRQETNWASCSIKMIWL